MIRPVGKLVFVERCVQWYARDEQTVAMDVFESTLLRWTSQLVLGIECTFVSLMHSLTTPLRVTFQRYKAGLWRDTKVGSTLSCTDIYHELYS